VHQRFAHAPIQLHGAYVSVWVYSNDPCWEYWLYTSDAFKIDPNSPRGGGCGATNGFWQRVTSTTTGNRSYSGFMFAAAQQGVVDVAYPCAGKGTIVPSTCPAPPGCRGTDTSCPFPGALTGPAPVLCSDSDIHARGTVILRPVLGRWTGTVASFCDRYPLHSAHGYRATVFWNDGTTTSEPAVVRSNGRGHFIVVTSHVFPTMGQISGGVIICKGTGRACPTAMMSAATVSVMVTIPRDQKRIDAGYALGLAMIKQWQRITRSDFNTGDRLRQQAEVMIRGLLERKDDPWFTGGFFNALSLHNLSPDLQATGYFDFLGFISDQGVNYHDQPQFIHAVVSALTSGLTGGLTGQKLSDALVESLRFNDAIRLPVPFASTLPHYMYLALLTNATATDNFFAGLPNAEVPRLGAFKLNNNSPAFSNLALTAAIGHIAQDSTTPVSAHEAAVLQLALGWDDQGHMQNLGLLQKAMGRWAACTMPQPLVLKDRYGLDDPTPATNWAREYGTLTNLSFAQILSEFGGWCRQSLTACEQTARCRGYCQQKAVMAAESMVVTSQYVAGHSALPSTQPGTFPTYSSVSAINTTCSGRGAIELTSNLRER